MASVASQLIEELLHMRKVTVSRMRERYAQTVLTFRITYILYVPNVWTFLWLEMRCYNSTWMGKSIWIFIEIYSWFQKIIILFMVYCISMVLYPVIFKILQLILNSPSSLWPVCTKFNLSDLADKFTQVLLSFLKEKCQKSDVPRGEARCI